MRTTQAHYPQSVYLLDFYAWQEYERPLNHPSASTQTLLLFARGAENAEFRFCVRLGKLLVFYFENYPSLRKNVDFQPACTFHLFANIPENEENLDAFFRIPCLEGIFSMRPYFLLSTLLKLGSQFELIWEQGQIFTLNSSHFRDLTLCQSQLTPSQSHLESNPLIPLQLNDAKME